MSVPDLGMAQSVYAEANSALFAYLDEGGFTGKAGQDVDVADEEFVYSAIDVMVQSTMEVPVVLNSPGSSVEYRFHTSGEDIEFGVVLALYPAAAATGVSSSTQSSTTSSDDMEFKTLRQMSLHESDHDTPGACVCVAVYALVHVSVSLPRSH